MDFKKRFAARERKSQIRAWDDRAIPSQEPHQSLSSKPIPFDTSKWVAFIKKELETAFSLKELASSRIKALSRKFKGVI